MDLVEAIPQDVSEASARRVEDHRAWIGAASLGAAAFALAQIVLVARTLGPADLGTLAIVVAVVTAFRAIVTLRTRSVVLRYLDDALVDRDFAYAGASLKVAALLESLITIAAAAAAFALAPRAAALFVPGSGAAGPRLLAIYVAVIPFGLLSQTSLGLLQYFGRFDIEVVVKTAERLSALVATGGALLVGGTLEAFLVAAAIGPCVGGILLAGLALAEAYRRLGERWARAPIGAIKGRAGPLFATSLRASLGGSLSAMAREGDAVWLAWFATPIVAGYYAVAAAVANVAMVPAAPFAQRAFPHVARLASQQRWSEAYAIRSRTVMLVGVGVALVLIVFGVNGRQLIGELFGRVYEPSADPLLILLGAAGIAAVSMWARPILVASRRPPGTPLTSLVTAGVKIAAALLLVPRYGAVGCAFAAASASVAASGLTALRAHAAARMGTPRT